MKSNQTVLLLAMALALTGCSSESTDTEESGSSTTSTDEGLYDSTLFGSSLQSMDTVDCRLDNGSETTCYQIIFSANGVGDTEGNGTVGPYCPDTTSTPRDEAGFGSYDGASNPGFLPLVDAATAMEADGYDIVDDLGNIRFSDLTGSDVEGFSYCLSPAFSDSEITYLVPVTPELRDSVHEVTTISSLGLSLDGIPLKGNAPSVTTVEAGVGGSGSGNIPSIDHCGGHTDPAGYYHWHNIPESMNILLGPDGLDYTADHGISCSNSLVNFDEPTAFSGIAKDGFPIYGAYDLVDGFDTQPMDVTPVDECNGHTHETPEFGDGVYHYHALESTAPNIPPCLVGSFVDRDDVSVVSR